MGAHYCDGCGNTIFDIKAASCIRLAEVWISGTAKTYISVENEKYKYYHESCFDIHKKKQAGGWQGESLF